MVTDVIIEWNHLIFLGFLGNGNSGEIFWIVFSKKFCIFCNISFINHSPTLNMPWRHIAEWALQTRCIFQCNVASIMKDLVSAFNCKIQRTYRWRDVEVNEMRGSISDVILSTQSLHYFVFVNVFLKQANNDASTTTYSPFAPTFNVQWFSFIKNSSIYST